MGAQLYHYTSSEFQYTVSVRNRCKKIPYGVKCRGFKLSLECFTLTVH